MKKVPYAVLLAVTILATLGGLLTLMPWETASYPNVMGYRSLCTFAPAASLFCFALAGLTCYFRASLVKETRGSVRGRLKAHARALVPVVLLTVLALAAAGWNLAVKAPYRNADTGASAAIDP